MELTTIVSSRCLRGILKDKLVILVTHQVHFALQADKLLALKDVSFNKLCKISWESLLTFTSVVL